MCLCGLQPARSKWDSSTPEDVHDGDTQASTGFKIQVAVRFCPGRSGKASSYLLPLHQRLKLLRAGDTISREEANGEGIDAEGVAQLLAIDASVGGEVLQAVLEAEQLSRLAAEAEHHARLAGVYPAHNGWV